MKRRDFIQRSMVAAVTVQVPFWFSACGGAQTETTLTETPEENAAWNALASKLEANGVLTASEEGKWAGKGGSHLPKVTFQADGSVRILTPHGMAPEHFITTQYLRDQNGTIIAMQEYSGTDPKAEMIVQTLPAGTTSLTAYSHCNLHDHWQAEPASNT